MIYIIELYASFYYLFNLSLRSLICIFKNFIMISILLRYIYFIFFKFRKTVTIYMWIFESDVNVCVRTSLKHYYFSYLKSSTYSPSGLLPPLGSIISICDGQQSSWPPTETRYSWLLRLDNQRWSATSSSSGVSSPPNLQNCGLKLKTTCIKLCLNHMAYIIIICNIIIIMRSKHVIY